MERIEGQIGIMCSAVADKLEEVQERMRKVESALRESHQSFFNELKEQNVVVDGHRTAAHNLILQWPSVCRLLHAAGVDIKEDYVTRCEDREVLNVHAREDRAYPHDGTHAQRVRRSAPNETISVNRVVPQSDGGDGACSYGSAYDPPQLQLPTSQGGIRADGSLDLDRDTVNSLLDSFMKNIHILHPFLDRRTLRKMFDTFIEQTSGNIYDTGFVQDAATMDQRPLKRRRSNYGTSNMFVEPGSSGSAGSHTELTPANAIIWLVLALGKICLCKEPLTEALNSSNDTMDGDSHQVQGHAGLYRHSPPSGSRDFRPKPSMQTSTPPTSSSSNLTTQGLNNTPRLTDKCGVRKVDIVPGLAYYAKATEILGTQGDGHELVHAQMFLLAALYKGQLARVGESMSWIARAGNAVRLLLDRHKLYNENYWTVIGDVRKQHQTGQARIKTSHENLIVLASCTCVQLESDILAEMRLPSSNIQALETLLLMPHNISDHEKDVHGTMGLDDATDSYETVLLAYSAQMFLRTKLNQIHREIYGDQYLHRTLKQVREMFKGHEAILERWRQTLPPSLRWHDDDAPSSNILHARLRAKYWGARYVIHRPFLDYALHIMPCLVGGRSIEQAAKDVHDNTRAMADIHLFEAIACVRSEEFWKAVNVCIEAAMQSTVAFDGIPGRLIVTNIQGTAHAYVVEYKKVLLRLLTGTTDNSATCSYFPRPISTRP